MSDQGQSGNLNAFSRFIESQRDSDLIAKLRALGLYFQISELYNKQNENEQLNVDPNPMAREYANPNSLPKNTRVMDRQPNLDSANELSIHPATSNPTMHMNPQNIQGISAYTPNPLHQLPHSMNQLNFSDSLSPIGRERGFHRFSTPNSEESINFSGQIPEIEPSAEEADYDTDFHGSRADQVVNNRMDEKDKNKLNMELDLSFGNLNTGDQEMFGNRTESPDLYPKEDQTNVDACGLVGMADVAQNQLFTSYSPLIPVPLHTPPVAFHGQNVDPYPRRPLKWARKTRGEKKATPDALKDGRYYEKRRRNNLAAKKSRDARKLKEDKYNQKNAHYERENAMLKTQLASYVEEWATLRAVILKKTGDKYLQDLKNNEAQPYSFLAMPPNLSATLLPANFMPGSILPDNLLSDNHLPK